jgi:hypothetical protein
MIDDVNKEIEIHTKKRQRAAKAERAHSQKTKMNLEILFALLLH